MIRTRSLHGAPGAAGPVALGLAILGLAGLAPTGLASLAAQEETPRPPPEGWTVRTDRGGAAAAEGVRFMEMPPGWHITTGPAAILYSPESTAEGSFRIEAEVHLFDPGERREGYGIFFGGRELEAEGQTYAYFLLRRDGAYLVKRRDGSATSVIEGWTEHPAIVGWEDRPEDAATATNVLAVEVGETEVSFRVNGEEVHRMPREGLPTDGVVGIRVNHSLDLHISRLEVVPQE